MVQLSLSTAKGNAGSRKFPHQGYLGLTPVRVDGVVTTRLDEDRKPILAKSLSVSVRAYESRHSIIGTVHSRLLVDYTQTLWRKPDDQHYAELGDFESTFKITLPKRVAGFSTANYQDYRTYWRLEVVLEHIPLPSVGSRLLKHADLAFTRYDIPPPLPPPSPSLPPTQDIPPTTQGPTPALSHATTKPKAPTLYYNVSTPSTPIGPSDLLFTSLFIRPLDPSVTIRSASLLVERRIDLHEIESSAPSARPPPITVSSSLPEREYAGKEYTTPTSHSTLTVDSVSTITSRSPLVAQHTIPDVPQPVLYSPISPPESPYPSSSTPNGESAHPYKTLTATVAAAEGASFALDRDTGVWSKTISLQWPAARSQSRWSMGETMRGSLGAVSFWVRTKVIVTSRSGTESIDLAPRELLIVLTNDAERRQALAHFAEIRSVSSKGRASTSPSVSSSAPSTTGHRASQISRRSTSPPLPLPVDALTYLPPKSAGSTTGSSRAAASTLSPNAIPSASTTASSSSKPSKPRKSRRPHTSAGPRESLDVRVGGGVPVPVPLPVPTNGYTDHIVSSTPGGPVDSTNVQRVNGAAANRHQRKRSAGAISIDKEQYDGRSSPETPRAHMTTSPWANARGVMHQPGSPRAGFSNAGDDLLVRTEVGPGVRMDKVGHVPGTDNGREYLGQRHQEDKTDLVRAWEEELANIEKISRRNSHNMFGFWGALGRRKERARERERERIRT